MRLFQRTPWLSQIKQWVLYGFIALIIALSITVLSIITFTSDSSNNNGRRVFESTLWNALQLHVQSYRFLNYLIQLDKTAPSLQGNAFFEYDLLMSRVDLLRRGDVGELIRNFENGRTTRLLNIINGELELLSFQLSKIENGEYDYLPSLIERLHNIDEQINEFVTLVNNGSNQYISSQRQLLQENLDAIQMLAMSLFLCLLCLGFFIIKGISELQRTYLHNKRLTASIKSVHEDKVDILAFIHQEIRSPISAILGSANTLSKRSMPNDTDKLSEHIEESGLQLLHTIEMLSDLALIDAKKLILTPTDGSLHVHIESCFALLNTQMTRKNVQSILYIDPLLPTPLSLDFVRVKEIVVALLQNAVTHTPSGSISLQIRRPASTSAHLSRLADTQQAGMLQIALRDTGLGMSTELQQHLRVNPSMPMQSDGTLPSRVGLHLALCHKLIYLMKGEMHFSCAPQKGCEFWVDIPFSAPQLAPRSDPQTFQCPDKTSALLIETDAQLAKILSLQLATFNINVVLSKEGRLQEYKHCDLVILGNTARFERDDSDALQQWHKRACPVLSYNIEAINHPMSSVIALTFPLTQSQLESILTTLFTAQHPPLEIQNDD
ncbi:sensor histidine kinase [Marinomonas sp. IMCC 4694]|uniref:sensor histidine kinase n=1 Tax=Marinomonas sp. IMCC 4694 TaxID=2605432 RepID=UPI0011E88FD1|nr:HAMP domain-containing sensor histidine kinase [Marinomonas sp. IMCC 4694]TYL49273.1 HAMP domain-containing histidine kinase [Marinomonas sp. IMCC 4694]